MPGCSRRLTWRNKIPVVIPIRKNVLAMMFGRRKGNLIRSLLSPKIPDRFSAGLAKNPPRDGPKVDPRLHTMGITENALGCSSFSGTISATIVRMIPTENSQRDPRNSRV